MITDEVTGVSFEPLIIQRVDKGMVSRSDTGSLVSQMQKVALHHASMISNMPSPAVLVGCLLLPIHAVDPSSIMMSASHSAPDGKAIASAHLLMYKAPRSARSAGIVDEVDDFLCWMVLGNGKILSTLLPSKC